MEDLDDRYGHPVFIMTVPICSVCKHFSDDAKCTLDQDPDQSKKWGENFDCKNADIDKNSPRYEWYIEQEEKKKNKSTK